MRKLRYVDRMARMFGDQEPIVRTGEVDITVDDMRLTVEEFYKRAEKERDMRVDLAMDAHLSEIFLSRKPREGRPAADIVAKYRRELIDKITYWTGVRRAVVRGLVDAICRNCERLKLWGEIGRGAGVSRRADCVRHNVGDEFPDSWYLHWRQAAPEESGK